MRRSSGRLSGRRALVTGAASGIGLAVVRLFAEEGARVAAIDRNATQLRERVTGLRDEQVQALDGDVSEGPAVERFVAEAGRALGGIDVVVNCAGVGGVGDPARLGDLSKEAWQTTIDVNLTGTFLVTRATLPYLVAAGGGAIVNLASTYAVVAGAGFGAYAASKGGIVQMTKTVAIDYAADGIRANALAPGFVDTPMLRADMAKAQDPEAERRGIVDRIPRRRLMAPQQVARVVLFLASDDAEIVTGSLVIADDGYTAL